MLTKLVINQQKISVFFFNTAAQLVGAVEYTDCISPVGKTPPTSVLDMTINNLMVTLNILMDLW